MASNDAVETTIGHATRPEPRKESISQASQDSQTAADYIQDQLQLEADAREALPYAFDSCTNPLGALRQTLFSCLTCHPPSEDPSDPYSAAGVCYSCSISCHGDHELVELFNKRNFVCDCGTTRYNSTSPCSLRINAETGSKGGVHSEAAAVDNVYNHNFHNRFCGCGQKYDAASQKGTMYQCLGLGTESEGCCGEDWWHPGCIMGLGPNWYEKQERVSEERKTTIGDETAVTGTANDNDETEGDNDIPPPPGFPHEDDFETFICYKCVDANPWLKRYAGVDRNNDFCLPPLLYQPDGATLVAAPSDVSTTTTIPAVTLASAGLDPSKKRKAEDDLEESTSKKTKSQIDDGDEADAGPSAISSTQCTYDSLPQASTGRISLFFKEGWRTHLCRCANHYPLLAKFPQLVEEEDAYEPPLSEADDQIADGTSVGSASLLDRGEKALSTLDRVRAIEGVMAYNHLKDGLKDFLKPFAESGKAVGAEDVTSFFAKLRGDTEALKEAAKKSGNLEDGGGENGDSRKGQSGY